MGWPDKNQNAEYVCQRYNRRLCSSKDLEILAYTQKRGFCLLAWAFDIRFKKVRGFLTNTEKMPCFSTTGGTYELPPYGPFPQVFSYTKNVLYYICVIKQSEREREYGFCKNWLKNAVETVLIIMAINRKLKPGKPVNGGRCSIQTNT
ncbi:threonyl-tRNA synthetase, variant 2 [Bonamia ostreae]|uniref:Threonyl-tRNA synthetase, variant 2 n=1 Tax=Bonamia ostreae TaxID=126728 RepID=A0ABV2AIJ1_9EUKA